jgi:phosphonate transport system permease protein
METNDQLLQKYIARDKKLFNAKNILLFVVLATAFWMAARSSELSLTELSRGLPNVFDYLLRMYPPNLAYVPKVVVPLIETLAVALWGTTFAIIGAIPLGFLAAKNIAPVPAVFWISRAVLNFFRAINEIIFGLIFVSAVGLGPFPGVLAIAVHSAGMLGKFFAEAIENVDRGPIEALEATGSNRIKVITYAIVPQIMPQFIAYCLYRFEVNVRAAAVLGVVGAGGIGFVLITNMRLFEFENLGIILFTIYITVVAIDSLTTTLRTKII